MAKPQLPSQLLRIPDDRLHLAYMVDMAIRRWGLWVEARLAEYDDKGQPLYDLELLLSEPDEVRKKRYGTGEQLGAWLDSLPS